MAVSWLIHGGDPNHLRNGMILQVPASNKNFQRGSLPVDLNSMQGILDMEDR